MGHIILAALAALAIGFVAGLIVGILEAVKIRELAVKAQDEALVLRNRLQEAETRVRALKQELAKKL